MKTWGCLARRHKGTEGKPVNGEKQKDKKDFLCGFVAQCEKKDLESMPVSPKLAGRRFWQNRHTQKLKNYENMGCLARRHEGTKVKPVNGEKQKDKKDFLCGLVREKGNVSHGDTKARRENR